MALGRKQPVGEVAQVFARCKKERRSAFIPFLVAGDPSLERTEALLQALVLGGADIVEIGVPFSDPIADGPVNQAAAYRALAAGTTLSGILQMIARCRQRLDVPIVLFTYFNPIHARGIESFADQASSSGVDGVLCVDLPPEEAEEELIPALVEKGIDPVFLLSPTSPRDRVRRVDRVSRGFVYYVSRTGVTGQRSSLPSELLGEVKRLRRQLHLPMAVGFGISTPEQVAAVAGVADGVVVGSALVSLVAEHGSSPDLATLIETRCRELTSALRRPTLKTTRSFSLRRRR